MHYCMKYRLNPDGTVPSFLCLHPEGVGGVYGVFSPGTTQHDDTVFVGLSEPNATGNFEIIPTQQDLESYLVSISADWKDFDPAAQAQWVWDRKTALDAAEG